jgi:hypothetical protein
MRYLCCRPRDDRRAARFRAWTGDSAEPIGTMETHRSRVTASSGRARRVARTLILIVAVLAAAGAWSLCTDGQFAPDASPQPIAGSDVPRIEALNGSRPTEIDRAAANVNSAGAVELAVHEAAIPEVDNSSATNTTTPADDDRCRRKFVGVWEDDYQGHRELVIRDDGTARMVVEPSGVAGKVFAAKLTFEIEWTIADGRIVMTTVSGEPRKKTNLVINLYGTRAEYKLLHLDDSQLLLLDADGKTRYDWRRVAGHELNDSNGERETLPP